MAEDEDEWQFSLEDLADEPTAGGETDEGGNVAGDLLPTEDLEPGDVDLENAVFVALGAVLAALAFLAFLLALT